MVGAYYNAAYVFTKPATGWTNMTQTAKLTASDGAWNEGVGASVSISGNTVVVGAPGHYVGEVSMGAAYVFVEPDSGWANMTQTAELTPSDGANQEEFGISVSISGDTVVVGAKLAQPAGAAYVFTEPGSGWANMTQTGKLTIFDTAAGAYFGTSVSISGDTIIVGDPSAAINGTAQGAAYSFTKPASGWTDMTETDLIIDPAGNVGFGFGNAVAISGNMVVVGEYESDVGGNFDEGAAYVLTNPAIAALTVTGISPSQGPLAGGTAVTITGTGFTGATAVDFGALAASSFTVNSDTQIVATSPAGTGTVDVTVVTAEGASATTSADQFRYVAAPAVTGINPTKGPLAGGTPVTITGTGFTGATAVDFGALAASSFTVNSDTQIVATSPVGTGTVDVTVVTAEDASATSSADQFRYVAAPAVTGINPTKGPLAGGTSVTITGTGFTGATAVDFGALAASSFTVNSDTQIVATSPVGTGTVDVTVVTAEGASAPSSADQFRYVAAPAVTGINPTKGPLAGGTSVTITGTGFTGATAVDFGALAASSFTVNSDTQVVATSPAGTGTLDVTVVTAEGTSATSPADEFRYVAAPMVTGINPTKGPLAGGTSVTITGTGFTGATAVDFGALAASSFTVNSDTQIVATSPAGTGTVDVTVLTAEGASATSSADQFRYVAVPMVTGINLTAGPVKGGTSVTIIGTDLASATAVMFGKKAAKITGDTATQIVVTNPAGTAGTVDVTVVTADGTSNTSLADKYTYVAAPTVTKISPTLGPTTGGTSVTITGANLANAVAVMFGTVEADTFANDTGNQIVVTSPAGTAGKVDIRVVTAGGTSAVTSKDKFMYVGAPTVTKISPTSGPVSGGAKMTITGTNLANVIAVLFGTVAARIKSDTATQIVVISPAGAAGTVDVTVVTAGGTSSVLAADQFLYVEAPTVARLSLPLGAAGGNLALKSPRC